MKKLFYIFTLLLLLVSFSFGFLGIIGKLEVVYSKFNLQWAVDVAVQIFVQLSFIFFIVLRLKNVYSEGLDVEFDRDTIGSKIIRRVGCSAIYGFYALLGLGILSVYIHWPISLRVIEFKRLFIPELRTLLISGCLLFELSNVLKKP